MENLQFHVLEKLELKYLLILKMPLSSPEAYEMFYIWLKYTKHIREAQKCPRSLWFRSSDHSY